MPSVREMTAICKVQRLEVLQWSEVRHASVREQTETFRTGTQVKVPSSGGNAV
jgi:hypothetical protein